MDRDPDNVHVYHGFQSADILSEHKDTKAGQIFVLLVGQSSDSFAISCFQRNSALLLKTSLLLDCWTQPTPSTASSIDQRLNSWR